MLHAQEVVLHLVHPQPVPWSRLMDDFSRLLKIPVVSYTEWLTILEDASAALDNVSTDTAKIDGTLRTNPALRLLDFFRTAKQHIGNSHMEPLGIAMLENIKAVEASMTLKGAELIGTGNVEKWVKFWKRSSFLA